MKEEKKIEINRKECRRCHTRKGMVHKYGLNICRRCFKALAPDLGFSKLD